MWQQYDDPFITPPSPSPPPDRLRWARPRRMFRPYKIIVVLVLIAILGMIRLPASKPEIQIYNSTIPFAAFQPPEDGRYRAPDIVDTFESYKFRNTCNLSSLDLHTPFSPLCSDRDSLLTAMSSGGRIGYDAPYMPRGCDMRWFTTEEVCEILGRFDKVVLVGDSMIRHIMGSLNILLRKDLGYGAVTDWNFSLQERRECFCNEQFDVKACSVQGIYKTDDVIANDPESLACRVNIIMEEIVKYPIPKDEMDRLKEHRGNVHILGHGLWSDLDLQKSVEWLDAVLRGIKGVVLFVTPNAAGKEKPDDWIVTQGNKALMLYEEGMSEVVRDRGIEHLGTWNMSIQSRKYDGVHLDMRGNLVKAMMVVNWLNYVM
ncbi:hypothetical protein BKA65DRAFT_479632 [Rhexocercosporidium sp. MPI-PUGE-AT-0058]|nr:hypothetical protein BKA65DRAFT_479632 [Rhexocercosporidium sp. MPI-PUGE-AT-0058]